MAIQWKLMLSSARYILKSSKTGRKCYPFADAFLPSVIFFLNLLLPNKTVYVSIIFAAEMSELADEQD